MTKGFSNCFNAYTKSINKATGRTGSLFQERFRRKPVASDFHFTELVFYIHANPQRHGFVTEFTAYSHSSYQSLCCDRPTRLQRAVVWGWFGGKEQFIKYHRDYKLERLGSLYTIEG